MSTKSKAKGTTAEREVVRYLREYFPAAERRALSGSKDKGDIAGIPGVVGEVKAATKTELVKWKRETLTELVNADADDCFLVVKVPYKPVRAWDFWMPAYQLGMLRPSSDGVPLDRGAVQEWEWVRMDFQLGREMLLALQNLYL